MAEDKKFLVKGELKTKEGKIPFSKEFLASSENFAKEKVKSLFGSNYKLKRNRVIVSSVEEVK